MAPILRQPARGGEIEVDVLDIHSWERMSLTSTYASVALEARAESAESAAPLLEGHATRGDQSARLDRNAVAIVIQSEPGPSAQVRQVAAAFEGMVLAVPQIPIDAGPKGGPLRFDDVHPATQRASVTVAAAIASEL